jgi:hypothetical protein
VNTLWTRPQVTYKSRLNASGAAKKQSQATSGARSPYSFLFPEIYATESMGSSRQHHASGDSGSVSILATISSALDNSPAVLVSIISFVYMSQLLFYTCSSIRGSTTTTTNNNNIYKNKIK